MICEMHGPLPDDWTSCPWCIRQQKSGPSRGGTPLPRDRSAAAAGSPPYRAGDTAPTRVVEGLPSVRHRLRAWLIEKDGPRPDTVYRLSGAVLTIGRLPVNDVRIEDSTVSGLHARMWIDAQGVLHLLNLSTTNGTLVNGARITGPVEVWENDEIQVGSVVLVLKRIEEPPRDPAPGNAAQARHTLPTVGGTAGRPPLGPPGMPHEYPGERSPGGRQP